jgi:D-alanine-D-alanine ligase
MEGQPVVVLPGKGLAAATEQGMLRNIECDVVFPVLHGTFGEDGTIQGLLECAGLPYVGAGVLGSALGMDKQIAKEVWFREGLPVVESFSVRKADPVHSSFMPALIRKIEARFGWPCFVKPACSGSSVGTSKVHGPEGLEKALAHAFEFGEKTLVERFVSAREIECAVLGNEEPEAFTPGEILPKHEFYDYEAKYKDPDGAVLLVPAALSEQQALQVRQLAIKAYRALDLCGMARVDFFMDRLTGELVLNEVNSIPGFTAISMYPRMCEASGLAYPDLLDRLVGLAMERHGEKAKIRYSYD